MTSSPPPLSVYPLIFTHFPFEGELVTTNGANSSRWGLTGRGASLQRDETLHNGYTVSYEYILHSPAAILPRHPSEANRLRQWLLLSFPRRTSIPWTHSAHKSKPATWHQKGANQNVRQNLNQTLGSVKRYSRKRKRIKNANLWPKQKDHLAGFNDQWSNALKLDHMLIFILAHEKRQQQTDNNKKTRRYKPRLFLLWRNTPFQGHRQVLFCYKAVADQHGLTKRNTPHQWYYSRVPGSEVRETYQAMMATVERIFNEWPRLGFSKGG